MICTRCGKILPDDSEFCQYCGMRISREFCEEKKENVSTNNYIFQEKAKINNDDRYLKKVKEKNMLITISNMVSIIFLCVSALFILIVANIQDYRRNYYENWNTSMVYMIFLFAVLAVIIVASVSLAKGYPQLLSILSFCLVVGGLVVIIEGSIFSMRGNGNKYINIEQVEICNSIWIAGIFINFVARIPVFINCCIKKWHSTVAYREKSYERLAKLHKYLESGIISQEEYEKSREMILEKIEE